MHNSGFRDCQSSSLSTFSFPKISLDSSVWNLQQQNDRLLTHQCITSLKRLSINFGGITSFAFQQASTHLLKQEELEILSLVHPL